MSKSITFDDPLFTVSVTSTNAISHTSTSFQTLLNALVNLDKTTLDPTSFVVAVNTGKYDMTYTNTADSRTSLVKYDPVTGGLMHLTSVGYFLLDERVRIQAVVDATVALMVLTVTAMTITWL